MKTERGTSGGSDHGGDGDDDGDGVGRAAAMVLMAATAATRRWRHDL